MQKEGGQRDCAYSNPPLSEQNTLCDNILTKTINVPYTCASAETVQIGETRGAADNNTNPSEEDHDTPAPKTANCSMVRAESIEMPNPTPLSSAEHGVDGIGEKALTELGMALGQLQW